MVRIAKSKASITLLTTLQQELTDKTPLVDCNTDRAWSHRKLGRISIRIYEYS